MSDSEENLPPGNWMARQLRLINDDSRNFFPSTASSQKRDKFRSLYKVDYVDFPDGVFIENQAQLEKLKEIQNKRETLQDVLFGPSVPPVAQERLHVVQEEYKDLSPRPPLSNDVEVLQRASGPMFSNWKIPTHVLDETHPGDPSGAMISDMDMQRTTPKVPPQTPKMLRQATLPAIPTSKAVPMLQRSYTRMPDRSRSMTPRTPQKLRTPTPATAHAADMTLLKVTNEELAEKLQPSMVGRAEDWLKKAPHVERKVVERLLRMNDKKQTLNKAMRRTLLPDARDTVERWLDNSSENERQVALQFFSSLAGSKLVGNAATEQRQRLKDIISTLKSGQGSRGRGTVGHSLPGTEREGESRLQFIRLLDPATRKNRWMHTTWHHLPEYRDSNKVENWSSHYTRPHAPVPRHFVIHPDWG